ncbi:MAG: stage II sporulation protein R [Eubacterium sp.]
MKFNKIFIPLFLTFTIILGIAQPVVAAVKTSEDISNKVFRLHILANSNSTEDQNTKLMLKNFILENSEDVIGGKTLDEAISNAKNNRKEITEMCNEYLKSIGIDYKVVVSVVKEYFKTRVYDDFTLPAGKYNSLKIELGEAKGHNWWCIVFPSVCLSACTESINDYLNEDEMKLVSNTYSPKFKVVEIYESAKEKIKNMR